MYNTHPHISTQEVSTSAKNGNERITLRKGRNPHKRTSWKLVGN